MAREVIVITNSVLFFLVNWLNSVIFAPFYELDSDPNTSAGGRLASGQCILLGNEGCWFLRYGLGLVDACILLKGILRLSCRLVNKPAKNCIILKSNLV